MSDLQQDSCAATTQRRRTDPVKLTEEQVEEIRQTWRPGMGPAFARRYGVSTTLVYAIVKGRRRSAAEPGQAEGPGGPPTDETLDRLFDAIERATARVNDVLYV